MPNEGGYIYVLTNPSFPEYVKIGYADNVEERVAQLNRSECTPFAFRIYAKLHVTSRLADKNIHKLIDRLKPELHAKENINGKIRIREFFAMSAEEAVELLEMIGSIYGETPEIYASTQAEQKEKRIAANAAVATERRSPFSFYSCGIANGESVVFVYDPNIVCEVVGDREVKFNGENISLTALARRLLKKDSGVQGPLYFSYKGEVLTALRKRLEDEGSYGQGNAPAEKPQKVSSVEDDENVGEILFFTMRKYDARCRIVENGFLLLKGSSLSPTLAPSCGDGIKHLRQRYAAIISSDLITLDDIFFKSSSAMASFVLGTSLNGKTYWKTKDGVLLKELLEGKRAR